jgi:hypothetical protein
MPTINGVACDGALLNDYDAVVTRMATRLGVLYSSPNMWSYPQLTAQLSKLQPYVKYCDTGNIGEIYSHVQALEVGVKNPLSSLGIPMVPQEFLSWRCNNTAATAQFLSRETKVLDLVSGNYIEWPSCGATKYDSGDFTPTDPGDSLTVPIAMGHEATVSTSPVACGWRRPLYTMVNFTGAAGTDAFMPPNTMLITKIGISYEGNPAGVQVHRVQLFAERTANWVRQTHWDETGINNCFQFVSHVRPLREDEYYVAYYDEHGVRNRLAGTAVMY